MDPAAPTLTVVVPCYNEAERLDGAPLLAFIRGNADFSLILVDDGSTDATAQCLAAIASDGGGRIEVLTLRPNAGKAEAVRQGMQAAIARGARIVGYFDADLSTPLAEVARLREALGRPGVEAAIGARVALLGCDIQRSAVRHYLGRIFATAASLILKVPVYDTQCGAKLFRVTPALAVALDDRFLSRWAFDVELLGRLLTGGATRPLPLSAIVEVPLAVWRDVKGSKLGAGAMVRSLQDLARIGVDLAGRRRTGGINA